MYSAWHLVVFLIVFLVHVLGLMDFVMVYQFAINVIAANTLFGLALPTLLADNIQLRKVAFTDNLTQVASRDRLEHRALLEINKARQDAEDFTLMVFDIDNFKQINDEFGHHIGDRALQQLCLIAQHSLRPGDLLGRFGGDEFVILLPPNLANGGWLGCRAHSYRTTARSSCRCATFNG